MVLQTWEKTVEEYNKLCVAGDDTEFGKDPMFLTPIKEDCGYYLFEYDCCVPHDSGRHSHQRSPLVRLSMKTENPFPVFILAE